MRGRNAVLLIIGLVWVLVLPARGLQRPDDGVLTVGHVSRIDPEAGRFELETAAVGVVESVAASRVGGEIPDPVGPSTRIPGPSVDTRGRVPTPDITRPRPRGAPIPGPGATGTAPVGRETRRGGVVYEVKTDTDTEFVEGADPIGFAALEVGDRVVVTGRTVDREITAYRVARQAAPDRN